MNDRFVVDEGHPDKLQVNRCARWLSPMRQGLGNVEPIPISGPSITRKEIEYVTDAVTNAWYGNANIYHERFEKAFQDYLGVRHAIALPSCTSAIHLCLLALGIGPGTKSFTGYHLDCVLGAGYVRWRDAGVR